jgi:hypothetical protein
VQAMCRDGRGPVLGRATIDEGRHRGGTRAARRLHLAREAAECQRSINLGADSVDGSGAAGVDAHVTTRCSSEQIAAAPTRVRALPRAREACGYVRDVREWRQCVALAHFLKPLVLGGRHTSLRSTRSHKARPRALPPRRVPPRPGGGSTSRTLTRGAQTGWEAHCAKRMLVTSAPHSPRRPTHQCVSPARRPPRAGPRRCGRRAWSGVRRPCAGRRMKRRRICHGRRPPPGAFQPGRSRPFALSSV